MNKICTSLDQSRRLIELGIDVNTADMYWDYDVIKHEEYSMVMDKQFDDTCVPTWSLSALLGLMPKSIISTPNPFDDNYCCRNVEFDMEFYANNPVDAVFETVVWLKENRKI